MAEVKTKKKRSKKPEVTKIRPIEIVRYTDEEIEKMVEEKINYIVADLTGAGSSCFATCA